ncbi:hypothetical protein SAMN05428949_5591 [Chitinophaga sp. YR627]|uniref:hypothetical protein n=1 Tax=Chitinophaga sp. YR627 TaxID=1881041 RepID=UPI0008E6D087|nr:hypothetical protein [Chitinophaga sp. YR627]SFO52891.1 hypothetical protein SAMN05428949_5591 [Chitinophaga sp. YR627]
MDERRKQILQEIKHQCEAYKSDEFEYYFEIWGLNWYPWQLEVSPAQTIQLSINDLSTEDLQYLENAGEIMLIRKYEPHEVENETEFGRKRYRISNSNTAP